MRYLPSPIPGHDLATIIHHSIVDIPAFIFNILLLLAIILKSPKSLGSYKVLLISSAIVDIISSFMMFMAMDRMMPVRESIGHIYVGPCVYVSGIFCHIQFTISAAMCSQSLFQIALSFFYRLYILGRPPPSNKAVSCVCLIAAVPNLIIITTFVFVLDDPNEFRTLLKELRPDYELDAYMVEGIISILNLHAMFTVLALTMPSGPTLIIIFIVRRKVLTQLTANCTKMSERTKQMHKTLTKVLTLQSMLPVFFSGAVSSYALCQFDIACSPVQEHFIMESVSFMALFAPLITLYCMKPYRDFVTNLFTCKIIYLKGGLRETSTTKAATREQISVI